MMTLETLRNCISSAAPADLQGMRLLKAHPGGALFPTNIPRQQLKEAMLELVQYTDRCKAAAYRLHNLTPIPLLTVEQLDYGL